MGENVRIAVMRNHGVRIPSKMPEAVALEAYDAYWDEKGPHAGWNNFQRWLDEWPVNGLPPSPPPLPAELDVPHWAAELVGEFRQELALPERVTDRMIYARLLEVNQLPLAALSRGGTLMLEAVTSLANEVPENSG